MTLHRRRLAPWLLAAAVAALTLAPPAPAGAQGRDAARPAVRPVTATVTGTVTGRTPDVRVRRAIVTLVGSVPPATRSVITDDDGQFTFRGLPEGRYTAIATKPGYLPSAYGATRPGRPGTPLQLGPGAAVTLSIPMTRGAAIEGIIRDEVGNPAAGVPVFALDARAPGEIGTFSRKEQTTATTDDRGVYRIFGLQPGRYLVAATLRTTGEGALIRRTDVEMDALLSALSQRAPGRVSTQPEPVLPSATVAYAPTYYPGVTAFTSAQPVDLAAAEERLGVDFPITPVRTSTIAGTITSADAAQLGRLQLSIMPDGPHTFAPDSHPVLTERPASDGRFRYTSVPPGHYTLLARSDGDEGALRSFAVGEVTAVDQGAINVALTLHHGVSVSGRVRFASASARTPDVTAIEVNLSMPGGAYMASYVDGTMTGPALISPGRSNLAADGTFRVRGVAPWTYAFQAALPAGATDNWWLRSAMLNGRDLLDEPFVVGADDITGVELTFTDQQNVLSGSLQTPANTPAPDYYIVVAPADGRPWSAGSRRFAFVRPASNGRFRLTNLPAGDYLLAALTDFDVEDFADGPFIAQLTSQSIRVTIADGKETVQAIELAR